MLIAIPITDDGSKVFKRTGRAPFFGMYELDIDSKKFKYIKKVINGHSHEDHDHHEDHTEEEIEEHRRHVKELHECDCLLALALGPNMKVALEREGVKTFVCKEKNVETPEELIKIFVG